MVEDTAAETGITGVTGNGETPGQRPRWFVVYETSSEEVQNYVNISLPNPNNTTKNYNWITHAINITANISTRFAQANFSLFVNGKHNESQLISTGQDVNATFLKSFAEGNSTWYINVSIANDGKNDSESTIVYNMTIDTITPTLTILPAFNNSFETDNSTIISPFLNNLTVNVSFFDSNLFQTLLNISNSSGHTAYSILNTSVTGTTVNISRTVDISGWSIGNYTIKLSGVDAHTALMIEDYNVRKGLNYLRYETEEGNDIRIISDTLPLTKNSIKKGDRYDFRFNYLLGKDSYTYRLTSENKITYISNSKYPAHFVIMSSNTEGNWVDFGGVNKKDISVKKIDDYNYDITVISNGEKSFIFNSIGGLNKVEEHYLLRLGSVIDVWVGDAETSGTYINATVTSGTQSANSTANITGARLINITKEITQLTVTSAGYETLNGDVTLSESYHNVSYNISPTSSIKFHIYDEISNGLITSETFSIYIESSSYSNTISTVLNPYLWSDLLVGTYESKVSSTNYPERKVYDIVVTDVGISNQTIYLINTTNSAEKTFYVRDSSITPIEDVDINFTRVIGGTRTSIAREQTDFNGAATLYLDENYEYTIIFKKSGYNTKIINLEPKENEYVINMISETNQYNFSVHAGITYSFSPSDIVLNNNTNYNFTFQLNSSHWTITDCTFTLKNGSKILSEATGYSSTSCYFKQEQDTGTMTGITSVATYELDNIYNFTLTQDYKIIYTYEGDFSLKNFLDDLTDFGMAGFDSFGRMMLALVVIFIITALAAKKVNFTEPEQLIPLVVALVWGFSYINWFYLDFAAIPDIPGLKKYIIAILVTLTGGAFLLEKFR